MKYIVLSIFSIFLLTSNFAFGDKGTFLNQIQFIQYSDENTALQEVKNGNIDLYFYRIPSERLEDPNSLEGLNEFQSTGGSYSIVVNPAKSEQQFNPFSIRDVRFALNYLIDRQLIVDEFLGGYGTTMISGYSPFDPDYLLILEELEKFNFRYNPALADEMISNALIGEGAQKIDGKWFFNSNQIEITVFIRNDDPIRKSIGEILSSQLEKFGFLVKKDFGDLNKAYTVVYGTDPADLQWNIYTEGFAGRSAFVKYDTVLLAQMYSPWFCNTPGWCLYPTYQNDTIDSISQNIINGNFTSAEDRANLLKQGVKIGISEAVRIFLASKIDLYVSSKNVTGIVNDFGAGIPSRFTLINGQTNSANLKVGVKQIYQGAWNPIGGMGDLYSREIWDAVSDPVTFRHPYTGETIPIRTSWKVESLGPLEKIPVPSDAMIWNSTKQSWAQIGTGKEATSKVTFKLIFGNWHNGQPMDMNDLLYSIYFLYEWICDSDEDKTCDSEFSNKSLPAIQNLVGFRIIDSNTIEVYQNYWHFDDAEIADSAAVWASMPWEIMASMEKSVIDGKVAFSRSTAIEKNIDWLSLLVPDDANVLKSKLQDFKKTNYIPPALSSFESDPTYYGNRYQSSISWIETKNHAIISNGPFYLENYSPEARTITLKSFDDPSYPFEPGHWNDFSNVKLSKINKVDSPSFVTKGKTLLIPVSVNMDSTIYYYFINSENTVVKSGTEKSENNKVEIKLSDSETKLLSDGANDLEIFSISESALRPDIFRTSFLVSSGDFEDISDKVNENLIQNTPEQNYLFLVPIIIAVAIGSFFIYRKKKEIKNNNERE